MGFGDYETAIKARDVHARLIEKVVNRMRPDTRQAEVYDFNVADMTCDVLLPGDTTPLKVKMGRGQIPFHKKMDNPDGSAQGDVVRVAGKTGSYHLVAVYGGEVVPSNAITMRRTSIAGTSIPNTTATGVPFSTVQEDVGGIIYTSGTQEWTVPEDGTYLITFGVVFAAAGGTNTGSRREGQIWVNGNLIGIDVNQDGTATVNSGASHTTIQTLQAGDLVRFVLYQNSGAAVNLTTTTGHNWGAITRIALLI